MSNDSHERVLIFSGDIHCMCWYQKILMHWLDFLRWYSQYVLVSKGICENTDELNSESMLHSEGHSKPIKSWRKRDLTFISNYKFPKNSLISSKNVFDWIRYMKMTREAPDVRSDKRKPGWTISEHQSASVSINQDQLGSIRIPWRYNQPNEFDSQEIRPPMINTVIFETMCRLKQRSTISCLRFLKVTWRLHFIYKNTTSLFFQYVYLTLMWNKYQT